jgi:hypothetical protein
MTPKAHSAPAGLTPGKKVDIRVLEAIARKGDVMIILYFEKDLAQTSSYQQDLRTYAADPEHERPFIEIISFLKFQREMSPVFDDALTTVPLMVTILPAEEQQSGQPVIKGILPFLDEMDVS